MKKIDAIIYYENDSEYLKNHILDDLNLSSILRIPQKNISLGIFYKFLLNIKLLEFFKNPSEIFTKIRVIIELSYIDTINPRIIISTIDTSPLLRNLACIDIKRKYYLIQNGVRTSDLPKEIWQPIVFKSTIPNNLVYFSFGKFEKSLNILSNKVFKVFPVGSFRSSISASYQEKIIKHYDLCIVSNYYEIKDENNLDNREKYMHDTVSDIHSSWKLLIVQLSKFLKNNNYKTVICLRQSGDKNHYEYQFFKRHLGGIADIIPKRRFDTYSYMKSSDVIISNGCTTLKEIVAERKKILAIDYSNDKKFSYPYVNGFWQHTLESEKKFEKVLSSIIKMDDQQYFNKINKWSNEIMEYDQNISTYKKIQNKIKIDLGIK